LLQKLLAAYGHRLFLPALFLVAQLVACGANIYFAHYTQVQRQRIQAQSKYILGVADRVNKEIEYLKKLKESMCPANDKM
jgi:hypothetical protein